MTINGYPIMKTAPRYRLDPMKYMIATMYNHKMKSRNQGCWMKRAPKATAAAQPNVAAHRFSTNRVTEPAPRSSETISKMLIPGYRISNRSVIWIAMIKSPPIASLAANCQRSLSGRRSDKINDQNDGGQCGISDVLECIMAMVWFCPWVGNSSQRISTWFIESFISCSQNPCTQWWFVIVSSTGILVWCHFFTF